MSSFDQQPTFLGDSVWDFTHVYWARFGSGEVYWCAPNGPRGSMEYTPWAYPEWDEDEFDEPDWEAHFKTHTNGAGTSYSLDSVSEERLPEGIAFRNDPQVGVGMVWSLFDPAKEVKRA